MKCNGFVCEVGDVTCVHVDANVNVGRFPNL